MTGPTYYMADDYSLSRTWSTKYREPLYGQEAVEKLAQALQGLAACFTADGMVRVSRTECEERVQDIHELLGHYICPSCGNAAYTPVHAWVTGIETNYKHCDECDHHWGHE